MTMKTVGALACVLSMSGLVRAAAPETDESDAAESPAGWNWAPGEGVTFGETSVFSTELSIAFDSKYLSYGLVDNNDPIMTLGACFTAFDWVSFGIDSLFDVSRYGQNAGYGNRKFKYQENDPYVSLCHAFGPDDVPWLPTTLEFELGYMYEAHPLSMYGGACGDTQFATFSIGLPDLWVEPVFFYERDLMRDQGTYLNLELGHTFALVGGEGEDDDPVLSVRPSVAQGWGDARRIAGYLPDIHNEEADGLDHQGLMDTCVKGEVVWNVCAGVTLKGYVAYSDYLFDPSTREASRQYEATGAWNDSWNFVTGLSLAVSF